MSNPIIFDIQRGSHVDGPGLRTVVFFKGCNLRCKWCHNPEGLSPHPQIMFFQDKCVGCGKCSTVCKNADKCVLCGQCAAVCAANAKKICGRTISVDELLQEILKDKVFYDVSGGGVTFSGGECMLQTDALKEILALCCDRGIHTAVDTAGNVPWKYFEKILPYANLFLYDVKCMDADQHKRFTGASNKRILSNLGRLFNSGVEIIVKIPIVEGFNADENEMKAISGFLGSFRQCRIELLPCHHLAEHKYKALGLE